MAAIRLVGVSKQFASDPLAPPTRPRFPWPWRRAQPAVVSQDAAASTVALDDVHLTLADGETLAVLGPSGCGKTTLLRVIAGLEAPTTGNVLFDGELVDHLEPAQRRVGLVFQNYALYPHMRAYDNVGFFFKLRGREAEVDERVQRVAQVLGVEFRYLLGRMPRHLSGGEQQRVAVGRCIIRDPKVFLFDEPLSNLDAQLRGRTRVEIKRLLRRFGITAVYVTHDQIEAMALGDRIAIMRAGRVEQVGTTAEIMATPVNRFVAGFFGTPPMNLLDGVAVSSGVEVGATLFELPGYGRTLADRLGQPATVGLRADDLTLLPPDDPGRLATATVELVQPRHEERRQLVTVSLGAVELTVREPLGVARRPREPLGLRYSLRQALLFDSDGKLLAED